MSRRRRATPCSLALISLVSLVGCGGSTPSSGPSAAAPSPTDPAAGASSTGTGTGTGGGAPSLAGGGGGASSGGATPAPSCGGGGSLPQTPFTGALCACNDVNVQGYLRTRAFNSLQGPPPNPGAAGGGAVGVNHDYVIAAAGANAGFTDVGGSFAIAGSATGFDGFLRVQGDLASAGTIDVKGYTRVERDAWLGGDFFNTGFAQIGRDLHIAGHDMLPAWVAGSRHAGPVTVAPPCACDPSQLLDVASLVAAARTSNDDAAVGLDPGAWSSTIGDSEITLPTGRYYLSAIHGIGNVVIHVAGSVALYVGGDVDPTGRFALDLQPSAQIDLFVDGDLHLTGYASLGDASHPYATRIYSSTQGEIDLTGYESFVGNLYAPRGRVTSRGFVDVAGSFFVRDLLVAGYADFDFDLAVLIGSGGSGCAPPSPPPTTPCGAWTCAQGQACIDGVCGACTRDAECPGQLVCTSGRCAPLVK